MPNETSPITREQVEAMLSRAKTDPTFQSTKEWYSKLIEVIGNVEGDDAIALALVASSDGYW